jgi:hypothetical protein
VSLVAANSESDVITLDAVLPIAQLIASTLTQITSDAR